MPTSPPDGPGSEQEFQDALARLIRTVYENGVDVEGGWVDRHSDPEQPDWGIEIYEVTKPGGGSEAV